MSESQKTRANGWDPGEVRAIGWRMFEPDGQRAGDARVASGQVISETEIGNGATKQSFGWNRLSDGCPDPANALISFVQEMEKNP